MIDRATSRTTFKPLIGYIFFVNAFAMIPLLRTRIVRPLRLPRRQMAHAQVRTGIDCTDRGPIYNVGICFRKTRACVEFVEK